ncbi:MAG: hypothetical protein ACT4PS_06400 [Betaproteobacteria bacterium]
MHYGAVSFVSLIISKEQKISEFRQAWVEALRSELAEFSAQARRVAAERIPYDLKKLAAASRGEEEDCPDPLLTNRQRLAQTYYSIRLRLNLSEPDHQVLLRHLDRIYEILNTVAAEGRRFEEAVAELDSMSRTAQGTLKREWNRVKKGEPAFATTKYIAKWAAIALAGVFGYLLWRLIVAN